VELRGKAATKGYWEGHGKKRTENTEKISSVFSVPNSVAKNLCFFEKDWTVSSANSTNKAGFETGSAGHPRSGSPSSACDLTALKLFDLS